MVKAKILNEKNFTKSGLKKLISRDVEELNHLSDKDLMSLWSFFKFLITEQESEPIIFCTPSDSIIYQYREVLQRNTNLQIRSPDEIMQRVAG